MQDRQDNAQYRAPYAGQESKRDRASDSTRWVVSSVEVDQIGRDDQLGERDNAASDEGALSS